jgi:hypothetical protein
MAGKTCPIQLHDASADNGRGVVLYAKLPTMTHSTPDMMPTGTRQARDRTVLSVPEAAAKLGVTPDAIRARLHRKTLGGEKINGEWRVYLDRVDSVQTTERQDTDRIPTVDRQDDQQDATAVKQDADRHTDSPSIVGQLIASKDETIARLDAEVEFLRRELETRTDELQRRDVLLREALGRIPQLPVGETRVDPPTAQREPRSEEEAANVTADTSQSETRSWWRRLLGMR